MDPKPSFHLPILQRQSYKKRELNPKLMETITKTSSLVFHDWTGNSKRDNNRLELELSPRMTMKLNACYRYDKGFYKSHSHQAFKNHRQYTNRCEFIATDKTFFRKRDELSTYEEHLLASSNLYSKK